MSVVVNENVESVYDRLKQRLSNDNKEKEILGHILNCTDDQPEVFSEVKPEHFNTASNRDLFVSMYSLFRSGNDLTYNAVCEFVELRNKDHKAQAIKSTLEVIKSLRITDTLLNSISMLKELYKNRQIYSEVLVRGEMMFMENEPVEKIVNHMSSVLVNIETGKREKPVDEVAVSVVESILNPHLIQRGLELGLNDIDLQFGGIKKDTYYTIGALSGAGKTSVVVDIIERLCTKHTDKIAILFFSLEMAESRIVKRLISRKTKLTNQTLESGLLSKGEKDAVTVAGKQIGEYPLEIVYTSMDVARMHMRVKKFALENAGKQLIIFLDHAGLVNGDTPDPRVNTINTSTMIKSWCRDYDASCFNLTQFTKEADHPNRKKDFFRPSMAFIMESGRIRQDSDVVWLLWRPETHFSKIPYQGVDEWDTHGKMVILNEKNRDGQSETDMIFNCNIGCNLLSNTADVF